MVIRLQNGRTSIMWCLASGCAAAISIACSRPAQLSTSIPPMNSRVSTNGPSLSNVSPSRTRTVVADVLVLQRVPEDLKAARLQVLRPGQGLAQDRRLFFRRRRDPVHAHHHAVRGAAESSPRAKRGAASPSSSPGQNGRISIV